MTGEPLLCVDLLRAGVAPASYLEYSSSSGWRQGGHQRAPNADGKRASARLANCPKDADDTCSGLCRADGARRIDRLARALPLTTQTHYLPAIPSLQVVCHVASRPGLEPGTCGLIWLPLSRGRARFCFPKHRITSKPDRRGDGLICDDGRAN